MFSPQSILNLIGQLGGNHQQAAQEMQGTGMQDSQIDPNQHAGFLSKFGINPQQLQQGGYLQHFQAQRQGNFQGYGYGNDYDQRGGEYGGDFQQDDRFEQGDERGGQYEGGDQQDDQGGDE